MTETSQYVGINVRSDRIVLSKEFCERYVKENRFVTPKWDSKKNILKLIFYPVGSDVGFRIKLVYVDDVNHNTRIPHAKFFRRLQIKIGRYEIFDAELDRSGNVVLMFKMEDK